MTKHKQNTMINLTQEEKDYLIRILNNRVRAAEYDIKNCIEYGSKPAMITVSKQKENIAFYNSIISKLN
jgi:hypothetical protein